MQDDNSTSKVSTSVATARNPPSSITTNINVGAPEDSSTEQDQLLVLWRMRWFFASLFAAALLLSILASIIVALITKNPLPALVPTPLLLSVRPIIRWLFPRP